MLKRSLLLFLTFIQGIALAQSPAEKLSQSFNNLLKDPQTKYAIVSICVLDARTGKLIFAQNENIGLAPASTLKTVTAATAFALLGKDFRYQTQLGYSGNIASDGTLQGNVIITGGGDPTLASWRYQSSKENTVLNQWVTALKSAGIKKIEGRIIGDNRLWGTQNTPDGWIWQDLGNFYGAGSSALNWRENQFDVKLRAGNNVSVIKTVPEMPYLSIINELKLGPAGSGDQAYAYLPPSGSIAYLRGSWASGIQKTGISLALPDPTFEAAFRLQDTLEKAGIRISNKATTSYLLSAEKLPVTEPVQHLNTINSPRLSEIIFWLNKKSVNLYAESLLKTIAQKSGAEATTINGTQVLIKYWANRGLDKNALNITDGSGLSPATRVTTAAMANILFQSQKESWFPEFYESLPLNNGMKIKSGTISDVSAFAGYHTDGNGNKYVIVININNYSGKGINPKLFKVLNAIK